MEKDKSIEVKLEFESVEKAVDFLFDIEKLRYKLKDGLIIKE